MDHVDLEIQPDAIEAIAEKGSGTQDRRQRSSWDHGEDHDQYHV